MPIKYFIHPKTNENITIDDALNKGALSDYYPLPYLHLCASDRVWKGKASTTQLLNGVRQSYLKIIYPYSVNPDEFMFAVIGTRGHSRLENMTPKTCLSEISLPESEITGIADLIEQQPSGDLWLIDYKTCGAFVINKAMGFEKKTRPMKNDEGEYITYKTNCKGGKKGDIRQEVYYEANKENADFGTWKLQLNKYKKELEKAYNIEIKKLKIFAIPRETDASVFSRYGVERKTYYIDIPIMSYRDIDDYFEPKKELLIKHVKGYFAEKNNNELDYDCMMSNMPEPCNYDESWHGRKCEKYCSVVEVCKKAGCPYL